MTLRRLVVGIGLVVVLGFLAIQLVPYGRDHTNPPVLSEPSWDSAATRATAVAACFDCHSNQAVWPWYSNIAPMSWLIQHDVEEGRQALTWSEWGRGQEGGEAAEAVSEGQMPPFSYTLTHPNATLSAADRARPSSAASSPRSEEGTEPAPFRGGARSGHQPPAG